MNEGEQLRHDPAMRWIVGINAAQGSGDSPRQMGRLETRWLAASNNLSPVADHSRDSGLSMRVPNVNLGPKSWSSGGS